MPKNAFFGCFNPRKWTFCQLIPSNNVIVKHFELALNSKERARSKNSISEQVTKMDTGKTRSTHVTKSNMAARAGLIEYGVMFASLGAVCCVLVDLLAVAANWIEDPCK